MNIVGPQVRRLRNQRGWTQPKLVARCQLQGWDISRESLAKIESQLRTVLDLEVLKLGKALGVHFSALYPASGSSTTSFASRM